MKDLELFDADRPLEIADQGNFFVGGTYTDGDTDGNMRGHAFVQFQIPARRSHAYPIVMLHGGGQTGVNFLGTPDGRRGWADYFVANGYAVYVVDQPGRGRSNDLEPHLQPRQRDAAGAAELFSASAQLGQWPQAKLHTQWPGPGVAGDEAFDQFYASQVSPMADPTAHEAMMRRVGTALLDRIGPAVLLAHSQGGPQAWTIGDACPDLTRAIIAVEPNGPPRYDMRFTGPPDWFEERALARPWGITRGPLTFKPPVQDPDELMWVRQEQPDAPDLVRGWLQADPPRRLEHLSRIPILILTSEASYHAGYDHCTSRFLRQAGVEHDFVRLPDHGIHGNGHMMMVEKNNLQIAALLHEWLVAHTDTEA